MSIRQQGGVFGRHPEFYTVATDGDANIGGDVNVAGDANVTGNISGVAGAFTGLLSGATMSLGSNDLFDQVSSGGVSLPAGVATTIYTFPNNSGVWFVTVDQNTFSRTDQPHWIGFVFAASNNTLKTFMVMNNFLTAGVSGLSLTMTNSATTRTMYMKAIRLANP